MPVTPTTPTAAQPVTQPPAAAPPATQPPAKADEKDKEKKPAEKEQPAAASGNGANTQSKSITTKTNFGPAALIGCRVTIYWQDYDRWYQGFVKAYDPELKQHEILYDDDRSDTILETLLGDGAVAWRFLGPRDTWEGVLEAAKRDKPPVAQSTTSTTNADNSQSNS